MASEYQKMKAVHYEGPFSVSVREIEIPKIQHPDGMKYPDGCRMLKLTKFLDVVIKVTTSGTLRRFRMSGFLENQHAKAISTAICGSDLHMYQGRTAAEKGLVFGMLSVFPFCILLLF